MKTLCRCLLLSALAGAGCLPLPLRHPDVASAPVPPAADAAPPSPAPPVSADQVDETNAHEKARALQEEMLRESRDEKPDKAARAEGAASKPPR
jgi:hypothetical protein